MAGYHWFEQFDTTPLRLSPSPQQSGVTFSVSGGVGIITIPAGLVLGTNAGIMNMLGPSGLVTNGTLQYSGRVRWRRISGTDPFVLQVQNVNSGGWSHTTGTHQVTVSGVADWSVLQFAGSVPTIAFNDRISIRALGAFTTANVSVFEIDEAALFVGTEDPPVTTRQSLVVGGLTL